MSLPVAALGGADAFGLLAALFVCVYLVYALLRGESL
jgi:hypothetical protein